MGPMSSGLSSLHEVATNYEVVISRAEMYRAADFAKIMDFVLFSTFPHIWIFGYAENTPRHISRFQL